MRQTRVTDERSQWWERARWAIDLAGHPDDKQATLENALMVLLEESGHPDGRRVLRQALIARTRAYGDHFGSDAPAEEEQR